MDKRRRSRHRTSKQALAPGEKAARDFARMNERKAPKRVKPLETPRHLTDSARDMFRRVAKFALAPIALARAVVGRFRDRD
jgi:phage terminase small subunit